MLHLAGCDEGKVIIPAFPCVCVSGGGGGGGGVGGEVGEEITVDTNDWCINA